MGAFRRGDPLWTPCRGAPLWAPGGERGGARATTYQPGTPPPAPAVPRARHVATPRAVLSLPAGERNFPTSSPVCVGRLRWGSSCATSGARVGVGDDFLAVPRQAATRDRPYGSCRMTPVRFHPLRGRCLCGARGGGRRFPPPCPAQAPTRERPYGSCRKTPVAGMAGAWEARRARWWWRRVGVGDDSPRRAPPRRPQGSAPTVRVGRRPYGFIPCGEDVYASRSFVAARVGVGDDSPRRAPPGGHKGSPLRFVSEDARGGHGRGVGARRARWWWRRGGGGAWGWATIPPAVPRPGAHKGAPLRFVSEDARTVSSPAGKMSMRRARSWRRAWGWATIPPAVPRPGAHKGAPLRFVSEDARTVSSPAGKMSMRRACWWWRRVGVGDDSPAPFPAQAPTRERPYGSCRMTPVRFHPLRGRCLCDARVRGVARGGGRRFPRRAPPRRPQGSAPTVRVGWRPYGFIPCGEDVYAARVLVVAARAVAGDDSPRRAPPRRPQGSAPTGGRPAGRVRRIPVFTGMTMLVVDGARCGGTRGKTPISIFPRRRDLCINPSCPLRADLITPILIFVHRKIGGL